MANFRFPSGKTVEAIRSRYPAGTRIRLNHMDDPFAPVPEGMTGTVDYVDDAGTIHMNWDNGRTLGLVHGVDNFTIMKGEKENGEQN